MRPCTQNPNLSAHEALDGMFSFDATPMAPIGTECMIHIKPTSCHTWGYHAIKAWYFAPALNHYRCIRAVTDTGAVRLTDTFTFLHHTLPTPTISNADRITKAIKNLENTISGRPPTLQCELEAIEKIRQLIHGLKSNPTQIRTTNETATHTMVPNSAIIHTTPPEKTTTDTMPISASTEPTVIPFEPDELQPPRYNLRSHARHIIASVLTLPQLSLCCSVTDTDTGKSLEYRQLSKHPTQATTWVCSYANELGRLTQGIRNIPGTNTMFFIHKHEIPPS